MKTNLFNIKALEQLIDNRVNDCLAPLLSRIEELENQKVTEYLNKIEAANYINASTSTIDNYVKRGLPKHVLSSRKVLFNREDLDEFIKNRKA